MTAVLSVQNATSAYGTANSATATVTATAGTPTGSVQFSVDGIASGSAIQLSSGTATYSLPVLTAGPHTISASYSGDNTFAAAILTDIPLLVAKAGTTTTLALSSTSINPGQSETFTATVTSATTGIPTGTVAFMDGTAVLATPTISNGVATYTTTALLSGTHTISANYRGDTNYTASSATSTATVTVAPLDFSISGAVTPSQLTVKAGTPAVFTFQVAPTYGTYPGTSHFQRAASHRALAIASRPHPSPPAAASLLSP